MPSTINFENHVKQLRNTMRGMQRILYVGTDFDIAKYPSLALMRWRCIYTTSQSVDEASSFSREDRSVRVIGTEAHFTNEATKLDNNNPMLIFINGLPNDDEQGRDTLELESEMREASNFLHRTLWDFLNSVPMSELVIVGYDPNNRNDLSPTELYDNVRKLGDKRVSIYGLSSKREAERHIQGLETAGLITVFSQDLGEELEKLVAKEYAADAEDEDGFFAPESREDLKSSVFINGKVNVLDQRLCRDFSRYGRILSVAEMETFPISRMMQPEYFYKFLKMSPNEPQWYGYTKRNAFAVERDFEKTLYDAVTVGLKNNSDAPVVLVGQSGSGKSISLANLAYRIYDEGRYPVLFVNNQDIQFSMNTPAGTALDNILKEIRDSGGKVLLILDWSVYRADKVRKISDIYINRGHNVLVVASAVHTGIGTGSNSRFNVINAPANLSEHEKKHFKNLMVEKGRLQRNRVERWFEANENHNGLLSLLYHLVYELHPQLERGINREINLALDDTRRNLEELPDLKDVMQKPLTEIAKKLIEAGISASGMDAETDNPEQKRKAVIDSLQPFTEGIAVSTLFRIHMPMTLAMKLLNMGSYENSGDYLNVILEAPWINYAMDDDEHAPGEYYVSFRDPIDARIYLESLGMDKAGEMKVVSNIISAIGNNKGSYYGEEIHFAERLIRMIGPNSDDQDVREDWISSYGGGCSRVIDSLGSLRSAGIIEPQLIRQEITYIREYYWEHYRKNNDENSNIRRDAIRWLEKAIRIARETLDMSTRSESAVYWSRSILHSITVESIFAELRLEQCLQDAEEHGERYDWDDFPLHSYRERYETLMDVIAEQPDNSYPYTALLSCFLSRYDRINPDYSVVEMMHDMSDVLGIVDATASSIPLVEENEFYQQKKNEFLQFLDRNVNSDRAERYFEDLISRGSYVGIYMKARTILREARVDYNEELRDNDNKSVQACKDALALLDKQEYKSIISNHTPSQYLRLQLTWLTRNKKPIFARERQVTYMNQEDWTCLYNICQSIRDTPMAKQMSGHYFATVSYIMALSCAQLGEYARAVEIWEDVRENEIHSSIRQRTWHILSTPEGEPVKFTGTFYHRALAERRIYIKEMERPVLYRSLQSIDMSKESGVVPGLCIGTSFRGFIAMSVKRLPKGVN